MDHSESWEDYQIRQQLSKFASDLHEACQLEPVTFFPPFLRSGFQINSVQLEAKGLELDLHEHGPYFIEMEKIGRTTFFRKHGHVVWIVPPWL